MGTSNFLSQLKNYIYTNSSIDNIGFYFHTYTESYKRFSKNGTGSYEITKDKLATAMKMDPTIVTDNPRKVEEFFDLENRKLEDFFDPIKAEYDTDKIMEFLSDSFFDDIIRNP